jgi:biotin operon repressor
MSCCKENLSKDEIGANKKLLGESVSEYYCINCLAEYLEVSVEDLEDKIEEFKEQGCTLFD